MCKGASLAENAPSDKQVAEVREGVCVYMFRVQGTIRHRRGTLLSVESSTQSYAQLHVFDVDIETRFTLRRCIIHDLGEEIVAAGQRVINQMNSLVEIFLRAG